MKIDDPNITHSHIDPEYSVSRQDPLNEPRFASEDGASSEIINEIAHYVQTQGATSDEEVESLVDEYLHEKVSRGEMDSDHATDGLKALIMEEWRQRKEELVPVVNNRFIR